MGRWVVIAVFGLSLAASSSFASDDYAYSGPYIGLGASYASEHFSLDTDAFFRYLFAQSRSYIAT